MHPQNNFQRVALLITTPPDFFNCVQYALSLRKVLPTFSFLISVISSLLLQQNDWHVLEVQVSQASLKYLKQEWGEQILPTSIVNAEAKFPFRSFPVVL